MTVDAAVLEKAHHEEWKKMLNAVLSKDPSRTSIAFPRKDLSYPDIAFLVEQLNQRSNITSLDLSHGNLEDDAAAELTKLLHVTSLDVSHNGMTSAGAVALLGNSVFRTLNLSNNYFKDTGSVLNAATNNHTLVKLTVDRCHLPDNIKTQVERSASASNLARFEFSGPSSTHSSPEQSPTGGSPEAKSPRGMVK